MPLWRRGRGLLAGETWTGRDRPSFLSQQGRPIVFSSKSAHRFPNKAGTYRFLDKAGPSLSQPSRQISFLFPTRPGHRLFPNKVGTNHFTVKASSSFSQQHRPVVFPRRPAHIVFSTKPAHRFPNKIGIFRFLDKTTHRFLDVRTSSIWARTGSRATFPFH